MLGSETYWAERKRIQKQALESVGKIPISPSKSIEIEKEIDIDKEIEKESKKKTHSKECVLIY